MTTEWRRTTGTWTDWTEKKRKKNEWNDKQNY